MRDYVTDTDLAIARNVARLRRFFRLSQADLVDELHDLGLCPDLTRAVLANLETGRRRVLVSELVAFAEAFDVDLLDDDRTWRVIDEFVRGPRRVAL